MATQIPFYAMWFQFIAASPAIKLASLALLFSDLLISSVIVERNYQIQNNCVFLSPTLI